MDNQYFERFPVTLYTNDNKKSIQIVRDITRRASVLQKSLTNLNMFEEIDIDDGSAPWIIADIYYNDPELYWVILHVNEIIDPRFEWPFDNRQLMEYVKHKYPNPNGHHHYEDRDQNQINGVMNIFAREVDFDYIGKGDLVVNETGNGNAVVTEVVKRNRVISIKVMSGGIMHEDTITIMNNELHQTIELYRTDPAEHVIPVTNWEFEIRENEKKRKIKILKPAYLDRFISDFTVAIEG